MIGAGHDWICAPEYSEEIARKIPDADLRMFERSAHSVITDENEAFLDIVRGFITYKRKPSNPTTNLVNRLGSPLSLCAGRGGRG